LGVGMLFVVIPAVLCVIGLAIALFPPPRDPLA
jgi:hypothetical protein